MNCKPGDLAIVVRSIAFPQAIGKIVRCVEFRPDDGVPAWVVDPPAGEMVFAGGSWRDPGWIYDHNLLPIRPNGVTDEEVRDLYAPKQPELA